MGDEKSLKREGVCAASLPTTMSIVAGFLVQNALKYLLNFGEPSDYLGYTAMSDYFPRYTMKPNPQCDNNFCVSAQEKYQKWLEENKDVTEGKKEEKKVIHEENEWGICVVDASVEDDTTDSAPEGAVFAHEKPSGAKVADEDQVQVDDEEDLSSLMGQLASLN